MPRLYPNPITPEIFAFIYLVKTVKEVSALIIPIIPVLPEVLLEEAKQRGTNSVIQYGTLVIVGATEGNSGLYPRGPLKLAEAGFNH